MLVERIMTHDVKTLTPEHTIDDAKNMMKQYSFRHIPIVDHSNILVGIISESDIKINLPTSIAGHDPAEIRTTKLSEVMITNVTTCHPLDFVAEIALDFYNYTIGAIPVVRQNKVIGIVTQKDMLNTFIELTGITEPGSIIEIDVEDEMGVIYELGKIFKELNIKIISVSVYNNKETSSNKIIVLRIQAMNPLIAINKLKEHGFKVLEPNQEP